MAREARDGDAGGAMEAVPAKDLAPFDVNSRPGRDVDASPANPGGGIATEARNRKTAEGHVAIGGADRNAVAAAGAACEGWDDCPDGFAAIDRDRCRNVHRAIGPCR